MCVCVTCVILYDLWNIFTTHRVEQSLMGKFDTSKMFAAADEVKLATIGCRYCT